MWRRGAPRRRHLQSALECLGTAAAAVAALPLDLEMRPGRLSPCAASAALWATVGDVHMQRAQSEQGCSGVKMQALQAWSSAAGESLTMGEDSFDLRMAQINSSASAGVGGLLGTGRRRPRCLAFASGAGALAQADDSHPSRGGQHPEMPNIDQRGAPSQFSLPLGLVPGLVSRNCDFALGMFPQRAMLLCMRLHHGCRRRRRGGAQSCLRQRGGRAAGRSECDACL